MLIDLKKIEKIIIPEFKGGKKDTVANMYTDNDVKIMLGMLEPGASIGLHKHENSSEIIYVLEGSGKVLYDGEYETLTAGLCHYCPVGHEHSLINDSNSNLRFFAVVPNK